MDNSFLDSFGLRHLKPKKGRIETVIYHSSSTNRNSMSHSKLKINHKKKLPIGFMVQNEVKSGQFTEMDQFTLLGGAGKANNRYTRPMTGKTNHKTAFSMSNLNSLSQ